MRGAVRPDRAERYGGDPSNVSLLGHSAGGNYASVIAFADPAASKGCLAGEGSAIPDNLVLFDGDWLFMGAPDPEGQDRLLGEDPGVMDRRVFVEVGRSAHVSERHRRRCADSGSRRVPTRHP